MSKSSNDESSSSSPPLGGFRGLIKVCGITQLKQLQQLDALEIDFAGLNFYTGSPRYIGDKISKDEIKTADFDIKKVGVFVDANYDDIMKTIEDYNLDIVQLHGTESPSLCMDLSDEIEVIKAFRIGSETSAELDKKLMEYDEACDYYLFDSGGFREVLGGTGKQFDWNILAACKIEKPFFLGGGIGPDDTEEVRKFTHPDFFAIDLNSKFEVSAGVKDMVRMLKFVKELKRK